METFILLFLPGWLAWDTTLIFCPWSAIFYCRVNDSVRPFPPLVYMGSTCGIVSSPWLCIRLGPMGLRMCKWAHQGLRRRDKRVTSPWGGKRKEREETQVAIFGWLFKKTNIIWLLESTRIELVTNIHHWLPWLLRPLKLAWIMPPAFWVSCLWIMDCGTTVCFPINLFTHL